MSDPCELFGGNCGICMIAAGKNVDLTNIVKVALITMRRSNG